MQYTKRMFVKGGLALIALASLPVTLLAAAWPKTTFDATTSGDAMNALLGTDVTTPSDQIDMKVPEIAENGAVVPVTIKTSLQNVQSISIVVKNNPRPIAISQIANTGWNMSGSIK